MLRAIQPVLYILLLSICFISCEKELSEENGLLPGGGNSPGGSSSGTSTFIMEGAPNVCDGYTLSGTYTAGTAVTSTNAVAVNVNVTTIGTYTISTATINGVIFSGSGIFTNLGSQQILLTASGTPTVSGTFNYKPGTDWCSFPVIVAPGVTNPVAAGNLDCTTATNAGVYTQGIALTASNTVTIPVTVTTAGTYSITTTATNGVTFTGSGSLASGAQTIVLTGSGLPMNPGTVSIPVSFGASTCNVSIDFLPGVPPAEGTLDCSSPVFGGTYTQGIALNSTNTVTIPVNVTTAGPYVINTVAINGVTFSGSGTLAAGAQSIVLTGSGTPANSGANSYDISLGTSICGFTIVFLPGSLPSTDYFRVKIDGVLKTFHVNLDGDVTPLLMPNSVAVSGDNATGSDEDLDVTIQSITAIAPGNYFQPLGVSFATSRYYDPISGQGWQPGTASSPALKVTVTSVSSSRITGTFSGQYFDANGTGTNSKQFTEGEFSVPLP